MAHSTEDMLYRVYLTDGYGKRRNAETEHKNTGKKQKQQSRAAAFLIKKWIMFRYYLFCAGWLWKNRSWQNNRHKFKSMEREWKKSLTGSRRGE